MKENDHLAYFTNHQVKLKGEEEECTNDGTVDFHGMPAIRGKTGTWKAGIILLCKLFLLLHKNNSFILSNIWKKKEEKLILHSAYLSFIFYIYSVSHLIKF